MVFDKLAEGRQLMLSRIHRQAQDNPILDLAHALGDDRLGFEEFEAMVQDKARDDDRVVWAERVEAELMARSPVLVWRNATRVRLIQAFRNAYGAPEDAAAAGRAADLRRDRIAAEAPQEADRPGGAGPDQGRAGDLLGDGNRDGLCPAACGGRGGAAGFGGHRSSRSRSRTRKSRSSPRPPRMGAAFLHGAAVTIHKAQGSQWEEVQVFAPDLYAAAQSGRSEAGVPLWKRLAYVAITRAQTRLHWVVRNRLARPLAPLSIDDLKREPAPLALGEAARLPLSAIWTGSRLAPRSWEASRWPWYSSSSAAPPAQTYEVANAIWDREVVSELYSTSGDYDLIAKVYIPDDAGHRALPVVEAVRHSGHPAHADHDDLQGVLIACRSEGVLTGIGRAPGASAPGPPEIFRQM